MAITAMPWSLNPIGRRHCGHDSHVFFTLGLEKKKMLFFLNLVFLLIWPANKSLGLGRLSI